MHVRQVNVGCKKRVARRLSAGSASPTGLRIRSRYRLEASAVTTRHETNLVVKNLALILSHKGAWFTVT